MDETEINTKLVRLLLDHDFFVEHKSKLTKQMFPDALGTLHEAIR